MHTSDITQEAMADIEACFAYLTALGWVYPRWVMQLRASVDAKAARVSQS
jgi:hypothetical protein